MGFSPRLKSVHRTVAIDLSNPVILPIYKKNLIRKDEVSFYGVDNGIRTHDRQSHNLTR